MSAQGHNPGAHILLKSKTNDYIKYEGNCQNWEDQNRGLYYSDIKITNYKWIIEIRQNADGVIVALQHVTVLKFMCAHELICMHRIVFPGLSCESKFACISFKGIKYVWIRKAHKFTDCCYRRLCVFVVYRL